MCRFLLVRSKEKIKPEKLLDQFADMCEKSRDPGGDKQADGWGVSIKNEKLKMKNGEWVTYKSLNPIWKEKNKFKEFEETDSFVVHARSAGFPHHRGNIDYNQPYISDGLCFVFNGMIKGVKINKPISGKIGAQKIFSLIQNVILNEVKNPQKIEEALRIVDKLLLENSREITGMNIGIAKDNKFYVLCAYKRNPEYFGIRYYQDDELTLVSSEPIGNYYWKIMEKGDIISL